MNKIDLGLITSLLNTKNIEKISLSPKNQDQEPLTFYRSSSISANYADDFGYQWNELTGDYRYTSNRHFAQFLRLGLPLKEFKNKLVLDAGCGMGRLVDFYIESAKLVVGVELSDAILSASRNLLRYKNFVPLQSTIDNLPCKSNSFDIVYSWGVVHHTVSPQNTLQELWRVVKPGGLLVVWVYPDNPWYRKRSLLNFFLSDKSTHEMSELSNSITNLLHHTSKVYPKAIPILNSSLCCTLKEDRETTKLYLYDGLGPEYHHLLDKDFFSSLNLKDLDKILFGSTLLTSFPGLTVSMHKKN